MVLFHIISLGPARAKEIQKKSFGGIDPFEWLGAGYERSRTAGGQPRPETAGNTKAASGGISGTPYPIPAEVFVLKLPGYSGHTLPYFFKHTL